MSDCSSRAFKVPELKPCPFCRHDSDETPRLSYSFATLHNDENPEKPLHQTRFHMFCPECGAMGPERLSEVEAIEAWNTRYEPTCSYEPEIMYSYYDDDDNEINTHLADDDGIAYECSECGFAMLREGWFTEEPGEHGGWEIDKRWFEYCPGCGAKVVD